MERKIHPCPVCGNTKLEVEECLYNYTIFAYNIRCPKCRFTGRSFKMRYKAIDKWNAMCKQVRGISVNSY